MVILEINERDMDRCLPCVEQMRRKVSLCLWCDNGVVWLNGGESYRMVLYSCESIVVF